MQKLVLSAKLRESLLKLTHSAFMAGHLRKHKTAERLLQRFYLLTLFQDVAVLGKKKPKSPLSCGKKTPKAPLLPLPVMQKPLQRITMDMVYNLFFHAAKKDTNIYLLVICYYGPHYPETIPLCTIDAGTIAGKFGCLHTMEVQVKS